MSEILPLLYFTHAELSQKDNISANVSLLKKPTGGDTNSFFSVSSSGMRKKMRLCMMDTHVNYEAVEEDEAPFFVGLHDKASGRVSVCNTPYFVMKPECYLRQAATPDINQTIASQTYIEKVNLVKDTFGSSKKRKALATMRNNFIDKETLEKAMNAAVEESSKRASGTNEQNGTHSADTANESALGLSVDSFSIVPSANREAKTPSDVYKLHETLQFTSSEFERFTFDLSAKFAVATLDVIKKWEEGAAYPTYVCEQLLALTNSRSGHAYKLTKCKLLAYMAFLLAFYKLKSTQLRNKASLNACEVPDVVINRLFDVYTVVSSSNAHGKGVRSMPARLKDKLTCHVCVLALHIDDFETSLATLQKDMRISQQRLVDFYQTLGCFVKSRMLSVDGKKAVNKVAILSLPLNDCMQSAVKKRARRS